MQWQWQWPYPSGPSFWASAILHLFGLVGLLHAYRRDRKLADMLYLLAMRPRVNRRRAESRRRERGEGVRPC